MRLKGNHKVKELKWFFAVEEQLANEEKIEGIIGKVKKGSIKLLP